MSAQVPELEVRDFSSVSPQKPWKLSPREVAINASTILIALILSPIIVQVTPLKGKLGLVLTFIVVAMVGNIVLSFLRQGVQAIGNSIASTLIYLAAGLVLLPVASIFFTVIMRGYHALRINTFTQDMSVTQSDGPYTEGGALHAIVGTLMLVFIASLISVPIGILTALYLTEVKGRAEGTIRFLVQAMSGVPSIVAGLFIYSVLIVGAGGHYSGFAGALSLSILMLPTVARTAEEVLKLIPRDLREAGVALGGTQWRTVVMVVVPAARSGIVTAIILGIARVAGETAPLLLTILGSTTTHLNPTDAPISALPLYTFNLLRTGLNVAIDRAWTGALVLMILVLILFVLARLASGRKK
ncbi:MAG: phosphate ABC transporter, permease protein PstA [Actinobacteria bacterium]|nr:MAG: phosphate ABC transporter, permease protein PstA [Actinomycetota bacterium]